MPFLSNIVVYTGGYLFLVFIAVCLATGLYYLAEMVEEYTRVTKKVLSWSIKISIGLNVALLVVDRLPFVNIALSVGALCTYHTLLKKFPFMALTSPEFVGSVAALVANHFMWMRHFRNDSDEYYSVEHLLGFFLMVVWIVPFGFFISLAANESVLPGGGLAGANGSSSSLDSGQMPSGGGFGMGGGRYDDGRTRRKRANVVLQSLDFCKAQLGAVRQEERVPQRHTRRLVQGEEPVRRRTKEASARSRGTDRAAVEETEDARKRGIRTESTYVMRRAGVIPSESLASARDESTVATRSTRASTTFISIRGGIHIARRTHDDSPLESPWSTRSPPRACLPPPQRVSSRSASS
jgi:hypothetical protein